MASEQDTREAEAWIDRLATLAGCAVGLVMRCWDWLTGRRGSWSDEIDHDSE